jgi:delta 1-pyrroline-5-carboxylate dehydrogenase
MFAYSIDSPESGGISRRSAGNVVIPFVAGLKNIKINYTAGLAAVPWSVRLAALEIIAHWWQNSQMRAMANSTAYGLMAAVWTENGGRQQRVSKAVKAGQVYINAFGAGGGVELPFGGVKKSGHGREKGFLAMEEMSTTKTVVHYHG